MVIKHVTQHPCFIANILGTFYLGNIEVCFKFLPWAFSAAFLGCKPFAHNLQYACWVPSLALETHGNSFSHSAWLIRPDSYDPFHLDMFENGNLPRLHLSQPDTGSCSWTEYRVGPVLCVLTRLIHVRTYRSAHKQSRDIPKQWIWLKLSFFLNFIFRVRSQTMFLNIKSIILEERLRNF